MTRNNQIDQQITSRSAIQALFGKELREQWATPALGVFGLVVFIIMVFSISYRFGFQVDALKPLLTWMIFLGTFIIVVAFAGGLTSDQKTSGDAMIALLPVRAPTIWSIKVAAGLVAALVSLLIVALPGILFGSKLLYKDYAHSLQVMATYWFLIPWIGHLFASSLVAGAVFKRPISAFFGSLAGLTVLLTIDVFLVKFNMINSDLFWSARLSVWSIMTLLSLRCFTLRLRGYRGTISHVLIALFLCILSAGILGTRAYRDHFYGDLPESEMRLAKAGNGVDRLLESGLIPVRHFESDDHNIWFGSLRLHDLNNHRDVFISKRHSRLIGISQSGQYAFITQTPTISLKDLLHSFVDAQPFRLEDNLQIVDLKSRSQKRVEIPESLVVWPLELIPRPDESLLITWLERTEPRGFGFGKLDATTGKLEIIETGWQGFFYVSDNRDKIIKWSTNSPKTPEGLLNGLVYYDIKTASWVDQENTIDTPVQSPNGIYIARGIRMTDDSGCRLSITGTDGDQVVPNILLPCRDLIESYVQWTPDSQNLVILSKETSENPRLIAWSPESASVTPLLDDIAEGCGDLTVFELKISPDGQWIAGARPHATPDTEKSNITRSSFMVAIDGKTRYELPGKGKPYGWLDSERCLIDSPDGILVWSSTTGHTKPLFDK